MATEYQRFFFAQQVALESLLRVFLPGLGATLAQHLDPSSKPGTLLVQAERSSPNFFGENDEVGL